MIRFSEKELVATSGAYSYGLARVTKVISCRFQDVWTCLLNLTLPVSRGIYYCCVCFRTTTHGSFHIKSGIIPSVWYASYTSRGCRNVQSSCSRILVSSWLVFHPLVKKMTSLLGMATRQLVPRRSVDTQKIQFSNSKFLQVLNWSRCWPVLICSHQVNPSTEFDFNYSSHLRPLH
jgi:hypothetical protein